MNREDTIARVTAMHNAIEFDADKHIYSVGGIVHPSVSELMMPVNGLVYGTWSRKSSNAMTRGTRAHKAMEAYDELGIESEDADIVPYLMAYKAWLADHTQYEPMLNEMRVLGNGYCGTIDKLMWDAKWGRPALVDIKTGDNAHPELWLLQLDFYDNALRHNGICVADAFVVQCRSDGGYAVFENKWEGAVITDELMTIHRWRKENGVK